MKLRHNASKQNFFWWILQSLLLQKVEIEKLVLILGDNFLGKIITS
jgi:hypothetical protein